MKLFIGSLMACALLTSPGLSFDLGIQLEADVDAVGVAFEAKQPVKPYFTDMRSLVDQWSDQNEVTRDRLQRAIADLEARCANAKMQLADTMRLKAQIIDARCDVELRILWKRAVNGDASRADFERVADLLRHRAEVAKQPPDLSRQVQEALDDLMLRAKEVGVLTTLELSIFEDQVVQLRLDRALAWLEELATERNATREQFLRIKDLMSDRARLWAKDLEFQALVERVQEQVDQMMDRILKSGVVDRSEFERLRTECMTRARAAVVGAGT
jgi:hypothetical protein